MKTLRNNSTHYSLFTPSTKPGLSRAHQYQITHALIPQSVTANASLLLTIISSKSPLPTHPKPCSDSGVAGLIREDAPTAAAKTYAIQIADTVTIGPGKTSAEVATGEAPKGWGDVAWMLNVRTIDYCGLGWWRIHAFYAMPKLE